MMTEEHKARQTADLSNSGQGRTVLVVDDDEDFLLQQQVQLQAAGYEVLAASSKSEAETIISDQAFDVAVVDLMMEDMDAGFVLCHHIKRKDGSIPVILVTGVASETGIDFDAATDEERSWVKADALLAKPIRFEQLLREMDRLIRK